MTVFLGIRSAPPVADRGRLSAAIADMVVRRFGGEMVGGAAPAGPVLLAAFARPEDALAALLAADALVAVLDGGAGGVARPARAVGDTLTVPTSVSAAAAEQAGAHGAPAATRFAFALHTGDPGVCTELLRLGHPGQVLLSAPAAVRLQPVLPPGAGLKDLGAQRLRDLHTTLPVRQLVHPALPADFPPLHSLDHLPHNLPAQLTSLVGREQAVSEVGQLLADARLVTLTGAGGMGKTRLALQAAAAVLPDWPQGAWLVELAPVDRAELLAPAVAAALGVREQPGESLPEALVRYLRRRQMLLVLDNCEHLVAACAGLAGQLLRDCPQLTVLATSREPLGVPGEHVWQVGGLALPVPGQTVDQPEALAEYAAVQLFVQRATAAAARFALAPAHVPAVIRMCRHLEGMPLAIELAAAQVRMMGVAEMAARLEEGLGLLAGRSRLVPDRHKTLRQAIDWSHALVAEPEQVLLRRLAVFAGGFALEAAEAVCAGGELEPPAVLPLLSQLVDRSLVVRMPGQPGQPERYRLLEPVRQYAAEKLQAAGEMAALRSRHRDWVLSLAVAAEQELLVGPRQSYWLDRFQAEHGNLQAALGWSLENGEPAAGLKLAALICPYWSYRAQAEGRGWLASLLPRVPERTALRAKGLKVASVVTHLYDLAQHQALLEECLSIAREVGDRYLQVLALAGLAAHAWDMGRGRPARIYQQASLDLARAIGDRRLTAFNLHRLAEVARDRGESGLAVAMAAEARDLKQELQDPSAQRDYLDFQAVTFMRVADYRRAGAACADLQRLDPAEAAHNMCSLAYRQGDPARTITLAQECLNWARERGNRHSAATVLAELAQVALWQGDLAQAAARAAEMEDEVRAHGNRCCRRTLLARQGALARYQGDPERAVALLARSLAMSAEAEDLTEAAPALPELCQAHGALGDYGRAAAYGGEGLVLSETIGARREVAATLEALARPALARGCLAAAVTMLAHAATLRAEIGSPQPPVERPACEAILAAARMQLGEAAFAAARAAGAEMTAGEAVAAALAALGLDRTRLAARTAARCDVGGTTPAHAALDDPAWVATDPSPAASVAAALQPPLHPMLQPAAHPAGLSDREVEIIRLVARGLTDKEIAASLYISPRTVGTHLRNIFAKVDVPGRTGLAAWAVRTGLAPSSGEPR